MLDLPQDLIETISRIDEHHRRYGGTEAMLLINSSGLFLTDGEYHSGPIESEADLVDEACQMMIGQIHRYYQRSATGQKAKAWDAFLHDIWGSPCVSPNGNGEPQKKSK
jgi:hypothetical protein